MENIRSALIASALILGIIVFLAGMYFLHGMIFGSGILESMLLIMVSVFFMLFSLLSLGSAVLVCLDVLKSEEMSWKRKILWILFAWFFGIVAAVIYYFIEKQARWISDKTIDELSAMRPSVSMPVVASVFVLGTAILVGGIFIREYGMILLILGTGTVLLSLYLSKNISPE